MFLTQILVSTIKAQALLSEQEHSYFDSLKADIIRPLDTDFKTIRPLKSRFPEPVFAMRSRKEKLEIRYYLRSEAEMGAMSGMPHVATGRWLMDISSNDDDAETAVHSFQGEQLATYQADWAKLFTFRPKQQFAPYQFAQLVALYKEGRGIIWVVLLFNSPPDTLDARQLAARFLE